MQPQPFDAYAHQYDEHFTHSRIGRLQREKVWKQTAPFLHRGLQVLEINCGTGEDAIWLAKQGCSVMATDASGEMIKVVERKVRHQAVAVELAAVPFHELRHNFADRKFHLVFSNFGGLNCASPDLLKQLSNTFQELLHPGGLLILVMMGRNCRWEQWYFSIKGDWQRAFRRRARSGVPTRLGEASFLTYYYSPAELCHILQDSFTLVSVRPIGLFIPPSYLQPFFDRYSWLLSLLSAMENRFAHFSFQADAADHYLAVFRKRDS